MAKKRSTKLRPDAAEIAFRVFQEAVGEMPKTAPPGERKDKNVEATRRGSLGGKKGGPARSKSLSKAKRSAIAKKGAAARWNKGKPDV